MGGGRRSPTGRAIFEVGIGWPIVLNGEFVALLCKHEAIELPFGVVSRFGLRNGELVGCAGSPMGIGEGEV